MSGWQNVLSAKCQGVKMSVRQNVRVFKMSVRQNVKMLGCRKWVVCKMLGVEMSENHQGHLEYSSLELSRLPELSIYQAEFMIPCDKCFGGELMTQEDLSLNINERLSGDS